MLRFILENTKDFNLLKAMVLTLLISIRDILESNLLVFWLFFCLIFRLDNFSHALFRNFLCRPFNKLAIRFTCTSLILELCTSPLILLNP